MLDIPDQDIESIFHKSFGSGERRQQRKHNERNGGAVANAEGNFAVIN